MKAVVHVTLKPEVLDPQGKAILRASASLGYEAVKAVRQGKVFEIQLEEGEEGEEGRARTQLEELCQKLLANPVIEDYRILSLE